MAMRISTAWDCIFRAARRRSAGERAGGVKAGPMPYSSRAGQPGEHPAPRLALSTSPFAVTRIFRVLRPHDAQAS